MKSNYNQALVRSLICRIVFPLWLAFTCLPQQAGAVVNGTVSGGGTLDPDGNGYSSYTPLGGAPAGGINPNDYAMCGLLNLSGIFDSSTVVEIVVKDDYYTLYRHWPKSRIDGPTVGWSCAHFTEFQGLPPVIHAETFLPAHDLAATGGAPPATKIVGGSNQACIWAGVSGGFTDVDQVASFVYAQEAAAETTEMLAHAPSGANISTYAFCSTYQGYPVTWQYLKSAVWSGDPGTGGPVNLSLPTNQYWCFMDGIGAIAPTFTAGIFPGPTSYYADTTKGDLLLYNCLPFKQ
ncbi:MAG TPA: hypothetical protein VMH81_13785 [Bryobacteraceae bacterium]|nr:hypothetical protein [Bryobacteraceae bacterium]